MALDMRSWHFKKLGAFLSQQDKKLWLIKDGVPQLPYINDSWALNSAWVNSTKNVIQIGNFFRMRTYDTTALNNSQCIYFDINADKYTKINVDFKGVMNRQSNAYAASIIQLWYFNEFGNPTYFNESIWNNSRKTLANQQTAGTSTISRQTLSYDASVLNSTNFLIRTAVSSGEATIDIYNLWLE